jgi:hypothetical protein
LCPEPPATRKNVETPGTGFSPYINPAISRGL